MPFLLAEILDFQGSAHLIGVGSLSKNPYEIFTLGSTSKYDQFGNVIGTGLGMYIIASTVREYNGDYKLTQIQNGFGLEIRIPL